jgi:hypothetical protein
MASLSATERLAVAVAFARPGDSRRLQGGVAGSARAPINSALRCSGWPKSV